jgi:hypothetical protein
MEIQQMWSRWIHSGTFDGKPSSPMDLARYMADAHKEGLSGWEIHEALRTHVRGCLRSMAALQSGARQVDYASKGRSLPRSTAQLALLLVARKNKRLDEAQDKPNCQERKAFERETLKLERNSAITNAITNGTASCLRAT